MTDTKNPKSSYAKMTEDETITEQAATASEESAEKTTATASNAFKPASHEAQLEEKIQNSKKNA